MKQSTLIIFPLLILALSFGSLACTGPNKTTKSDAVSKNMKELEEEPAQPAPKNLYLMLRLAKNDSTGVIDVLTVENQVYEKQGNPLPISGDIAGENLFTCEIRQENGEVIRKSEQKIKFTLGDKGNEAILKFILPFPEEAHYVEVNHLNDQGVWQKLFSEKL